MTWKRELRWPCCCPARARGPVSTIELVWSKSLTDMAERFAVPLEPIFRANDESVALLG